MRAFTSLLLAAVLFSVTALNASLAGAQPTPPSAAKPSASPNTQPISWTTERVAIFKDGYALVVKAAKVSVRDRVRFTSDDVPDAAVLGCFWAVAEGASITGMTAEWVEERTERERDAVCLNVLDLLRANRGKQVTLGLVPPQAPIAGTVVEILEEPAPPASARQPEASSPLAEALYYRRSLGDERASDSAVAPEGETIRGIVSIGGTFVVIATGDHARIAFPIAQIASVTGTDLVTRTTRREEVVKRAKRLSIDVQPAPPTPASNQSSSETTLRLFYFTPGVRWIPTYRVATATAEATEADLSLQAEVLNELEDFTGAKVDLVVGVPHFRFKGVISPMSLEPVLRSALSQAAPQLMSQSNQFSNAMFSQRSSEYTTRNVPSNGAESPVDFGDNPFIDAAGGGQNDDLFVYPLESFTLAKGARATIPLWTAKSPVKHVYTMDLAIMRDKQAPSGTDYSYGRSNRWNPSNPNPGPPSVQSPLELADGRVWHQLELKNNTNVPWTTGAALLLRGTLPLGQDLLTYTPVKAQTRLPVTVAIDVQGSYAEVEIAREPNALRWNGDSYALVKKRATIKISNYRRVDTDTRVQLSIGGKALTASEAGVIKINDYRRDDWAQNGHDFGPSNHSDVEWSFSLEPAKSKELVVEFQMYMR